MIDLHCHLLPGVDDGSGDMEQTLSMCRIAAEQGCTVLVATPHQRHPSWWNGDRKPLLKALEETRERARGLIEILPGAEIRADAELLDEIDELPGGDLLSLAGSRYLLVELNRTGQGPDPASLVHEIVVSGWIPVIAHPELYRWLTDEPASIDRLVASGALMQLTATSLLGGFGPRPQQACHTLIDLGLAHFVASDAHDTEIRPPGLRVVHDRIESLWGADLARALTFENPLAVIEDRALPATSLATPTGCVVSPRILQNGRRGNRRRIWGS